MTRACDSFWIIFGVVPELISEWKPLSAPQAMVMNRKGNRSPAKAGPVPVLAKVVTAGMLITGSTMRIDSARKRIVPTFMKVLR